MFTNRMKMVALGSATLLALGGTAIGTVAQAAPDTAPLYVPKADAIPGKYIVVMKDQGAKVRAQSSTSIASTLSSKGASDVKTYSALGMVSAVMGDAAVNEARSNPQVLFVEQAKKVKVADVKTAGTQTGATWGLDRIDQQSLPLNRTYTYNQTGRGVNAYIIDTGVYRHSEYSSRLGTFYDAIDKGSSWRDGHGHGTHVAGTVGGSTYGVAKKVTIHGVRVLNDKGEGEDPQVIDGMDWVARNAKKPAVANMSLGGEYGKSTDEATARLVASGVTIAVAAGNDYGKDACNYSPASTATAITVGSTDKSDNLSDFSNIGRCVDILAPGSDITSSWNNGRTNTISGTSMATPHVAGAIALYLEANPNSTPAQVDAGVKAAAVRGKIKGVSSSTPNLLLQNTFSGTGPKPTTEPTSDPTVDPTADPTTEPTEPGNPGGDEFSNNTRMSIPDRGRISSKIDSSKVGGGKVTVTINVDHPCSQNLSVAITTPDGKRNVVKRSQYASAASCDRWSGARSETYTMRSATNGPWTLEISDDYSGNTGSLNGWSIKFS